MHLHAFQAPDMAVTLMIGSAEHRLLRYCSVSAFSVNGSTSGCRGRARVLLSTDALPCGQNWPCTPFRCICCWLGCWSCLQYLSFDGRQAHTRGVLEHPWLAQCFWEHRSSTIPSPPFSYLYLGVCCCYLGCSQARSAAQVQQDAPEGAAGCHSSAGAAPWPAVWSIKPVQGMPLHAAKTNNLAYWTSYAHTMTRFKGALLLQVSLGITTLLTHVPPSLGAAHQATALALFSTAVALMYSLKPAFPRYTHAMQLATPAAAIAVLMIGAAVVQTNWWSAWMMPLHTENWVCKADFSGVSLWPRAQDFLCRYTILVKLCNMGSSAITG